MAGEGTSLCTVRRRRVTHEGSARGLAETGCEGCFATRVSLATENVWLRKTKRNRSVSFASRTEFGLNDTCNRVYLLLKFFLGVLCNLYTNSFV